MVDSKDKGNRGENKAKKLLSKWWGTDFVRTPKSGGFHTKEFREDWNAEADVVTTDPAFPFSVEVKWQEEWTLDHLLTSPKSKIWEWWEQAKSQTPKHKFTLLVFKRNYQPFFIMTRIEESHTTYHRSFVENSNIRVFDRQGHEAYIRLFDDLLKEPVHLWELKD